MSDRVLTAVVERAAADPATVGVLLKGSPVDAESDYDLVWILTDAACDRRDPLHVREPPLDIAYSSPQRLRDAAASPGWWSAGLARTRVLFDRSGEATELASALAEMTPELARAQTPEWFDGYLNSYYRSLKAWRRGDELAGRIEAAESVIWLVRTLFGLERRHAPYPNALARELPQLEPQGWPPGYLAEMLLEIVSTGSPTAQQELERRVETLLRERGYGYVVDGWEGEIERVSAFVFGS